MTIEMPASHGRFLLGVDGGGTKTEAVIAVAVRGGDAPQEISRAVSGPGNLLTSEQAMLNVETAIAKALEFARGRMTGDTRIDSACLSLAGTGRVETMKAWNRWIERNRVASNVVVRDDVAPILRQCGTKGPAIAVIAGTGSIAVGRKEDGSRVRCGGWGPMISDEGSGYSIACRALRAASYHEDGRSVDSKLYSATLEYFDVQEFTELIPKIQLATREEVSLFARALIERETELEDSGLRMILEESSFELVEMIDTVARKVALPNQRLPVALAGGVLCHAGTVRESMLQELAKREFSLLPAVVRDPVWGAVLLAADATA